MKKILLLVAIFATTILSAQVTIFEDDFESYPDFEIVTIGSWTQIDMDASPTYGSNSYDFTNEQYTGTAIIFNAASTLLEGSVAAGTPSADPATGTAWDAYAGSKGLYFIAATSLLNDDYMISPQIDLSGATGSSLSFWSKSITDAYGLERYEVLVSTTGTAVADFTDVGGGEQQAPITYTETTVDLSAYDGQMIYVALRYKAQDSFVWQVDNFKVEAQTVASTDDNELASNVNIYPTTVDSQLTIENNSSIALIKANIIDVNGRLIKTQNLNDLIGSTTIDVSNLNAGLYFVELQSNSSKLVKKIVKK